MTMSTFVADGPVHPCGAGRRTASRRLLGVVVALLLTVGLVTGCGTASTSSGPAPAASSANSSAATSGSSGALAADGSTTAAAVGTCPTSNTVAFAKTKFVAHAALAFGAFHRYLYKPFRAGAFSKGVHGRFVAFVKAGLAAAFIEHEIRLTAGDAQANPTLCRLIAAPLKSLYSSVTGAVSDLRSGSTAGLQSAESSLTSIGSAAASKGASIVENPNAAIG